VVDAPLDDAAAVLVVREHLEAVQNLLVDELYGRVADLVDELLDDVVPVVAHYHFADVAFQLSQDHVQQLRLVRDFLDDLLHYARGAGVHAQSQDSSLDVLDDQVQLRRLERGNLDQLH
jgi:hypothetical protein